METGKSGMEGNGSSDTGLRENWPSPTCACMDKMNGIKIVNAFTLRKILLLFTIIHILPRLIYKCTIGNNFIQHFIICIAKYFDRTDYVHTQNPNSYESQTMIFE